MKTHILGFPSIGKNRELKKNLEAFWKNEISGEELKQRAVDLKKRHWQIQKDSGLDYVTTGDFSLYDRMQDISFMLGVFPRRFHKCSNDNALDRYFSLCRGDAERNIAALEMTKWFNTNYHYLVPEIEDGLIWQDNSHPVVGDSWLAKKLGFSPKAALIGPFTWLSLAKEKGKDSKWKRLDELIDAYCRLIEKLSPFCEWIQIEEPILCTENQDKEVKDHFLKAYEKLNKAALGTKLMLSFYFDSPEKNFEIILKTGCAGIHLDLVNGEKDFEEQLSLIPENTKLSLGLVNGRNIWKTDYIKALQLAEKAIETLGMENIMLSTSCSLLHCPIDLQDEKALPEHIKERMAFAVQKCKELSFLAEILKSDDKETLQKDIKQSKEVKMDKEGCISEVRRKTASIKEEMLKRKSPYHKRKIAQKIHDFPLFPTTSIGSFPQTTEIRQARLKFKSGLLNEEVYTAIIKGEIKKCIEKQEELGLDLLVHGEAERNDMVEYFAEKLAGFCFTQNGWVQSYGSRCVKPPIIYADVYRKDNMGLNWILYAQSLSEKPVKGMLTGPVTILSWSFVRDDVKAEEVAYQLAFAIREEVEELEKAGIAIIQIDEAALREGMPLKKDKAEDYLKWAIDAFRLASSSVKDTTQLHTHMCYSDFNTILPWIARMDADVISIEASRSDMRLLNAFEDFHYEAELGPGIYDIHSPRIPKAEEIVKLLKKALEHIKPDQLWVNPDCGLKTRSWEEAYPALENMVKAAQELRKTALIR